MAYPSTSTPKTTVFSATTYSMAVSMPTTVNSGDLLIAIVETRYTYPPGPWAAPSGWTNLFNQVGGGSVGTLSVFYKYANGTEGGTTPTWTWNGGSATTASWQVYDITGSDGSTAPYYATASGDSTTNPSSPALTPSGGSASYLWLAIVGDAATGSAFTSAPSGYSGFINTVASSGGAATELASSYLQATASSETPGVWGYGSNRFWSAATLAIRPASGGSSLTNTQSAKARIAVNTTTTQSAKARIQTNPAKTQSAVARIQESISKTQSAISRIQQSFTKTQSATARLQKTVVKSQSAIARIQQTISVTHSAVSRISNSFTKSQSAVAKIVTSNIKNQTATARIQVSVGKTQSSVARLAVNDSTTQSTIARIANSFTKTHSAISRISNSFSKTQSAVARTSILSSKTQSAKASISGGILTKTQIGKARIVQTILKTQSALSRIANSFTKTTTGKSRISQTYTKTQSAKSTIASTFSKTQTAAAHILAYQVPITDITFTSPTDLSMSAADTVNATTVQEQASVSLSFIQEANESLSIEGPGSVNLTAIAPKDDSINGNA